MDQSLGSSTTIVETRLLNRNAVGVGTNLQLISTSEKSIRAESESKPKIFIREGNALRLDFLEGEKVDLICTRPPYADVIRHSNNIEGDMSYLDTESFLVMMEKVVQEPYRVLKKGKVCTTTMGDIRKKGQMILLGFKTMECFIKRRLRLKEIILEEQHNCKSTKVWERRSSKFLLLVHEYIFIFETQSLSTLSESSNCYFR